MSDQSSPRIAILGAGPAGCTLARLLLNAHIDCTIFEGEASLSTRTQGGSLDLHPSTGQKALKDCGLREQFQKHARYDGEAIAVMDKNMTAYIKAGGSTADTSRGRPEIDRPMLRQILVESLPNGIIQWGKRVAKVQEEGDTYSIHFTNGKPEEGFDLVIGADGAWSKVRPLLSPAVPYFAGLGGFDMVVPNAEVDHPDIHALVNRGSIFSFSDHTGLTLQQRGDGTITCYAWSVRAENWMQECGFDVHDAVAVKKHLADIFKDWKHPLGKAPSVTDDSLITPRSLYILPVGHRWAHKPGATLIGDAAHLMSPFAGEGVNLAMQDAMRLAEAIIKATGSEEWKSGAWGDIRAFEEDMFKRATPIQALSNTQMETMFFTPGAPRTSIAGWVRNALLGESFDVWWWKILVPRWFVWCLLKAFFRW